MPQNTSVGVRNITYPLTPPTPFPTTLAAGATWNSGLLRNRTLNPNLTFCITSDQNGTASIQRYGDTAGLAPVGPAIPLNVVANEPASLSVTDGAPYQTFIVTFENTGGVAANISNCVLLAGPH